MDERKFAEILIEKLELKNPGFEFETDTVLSHEKQRLGITIKNSYGVSPIVYVDEVMETMLSRGMSIDEMVTHINDAFGRGIASMTGETVAHDVMKMLGEGAKFPDEMYSCRLLSEDELADNLSLLATRKAADGLYLVLQVRCDAEDDTEIRAVIPSGIYDDAEEKRIFKAAIDNLAKHAVFIDGSESDEDPMYILGNDTGSFGAACIFGTGVADDIAEKLGCDYYILPVSKHDILIIPDPDDDFIDEDGLKALLYAGNRDEKVLSREDVLTDTVYKYVKGKIVAI